MGKPTAVEVAVAVGVFVGTGVTVAVAVAVTEGVFVGTGVMVAVEDGEAVAVGADVAVG